MARLPDLRRTLRSNQAMSDIPTLTQILPAPPAEPAGSSTLTLPFERRQVTRQRVTLDDGREALLDLPRGRVLRDGDWLGGPDGGPPVQVQAAREAVVHLTADAPERLMAIAYHLGNRHVAVQVAARWLRIAADPVLEAMVRGLGGRCQRLRAPFEPEGGAYGGGHGHEQGQRHDEGHASGHGHALAPAGGANPQHGAPGHVHGPGCSHGHDHGPAHAAPAVANPPHGAPGHVHGPGCGHGAAAPQPITIQRRGPTIHSYGEPPPKQD